MCFLNLSFPLFVVARIRNECWRVTLYQKWNKCSSIKNIIFLVHDILGASIMKPSFWFQAFSEIELNFYIFTVLWPTGNVFLLYVFLHWFSHFSDDNWCLKLEKQHRSNKHWKKEKLQCIPAFGSKSANALIFHDIDTQMLNMFEFCAWHKSEVLSNFQEIESHARKHRICCDMKSKFLHINHNYCYNRAGSKAQIKIKDSHKHSTNNIIIKCMENMAHRHIRHKYP